MPWWAYILLFCAVAGAAAAGLVWLFRRVEREEAERAMEAARRRRAEVQLDVWEARETVENKELSSVVSELSARVLRDRRGGPSGDS